MFCEYGEYPEKAPDSQVRSRAFIGYVALHLLIKRHNVLRRVVNSTEGPGYGPNIWVLQWT
jgi:hypothetical protein